MSFALSAHPEFRTGVWRLDANHSVLTFSVKHLMISTVRGSFDRFDVTVVTSDDPDETAVDAVVDVLSINTRNSGRDEHLRSSDFLSASDYPNIVFRSTRIDVIDQSSGTVTGDLTLRGVTAPVTLEVEFGGVLVDATGKAKAGGTARTKIDRRDFGVNWNRTLDTGGVTVGNEITITIDLELVRQ